MTSYTPHVSDAKSWEAHFLAMAEGRTKRSGQFYRLKSNPDPSKSKAEQESIKVVAPTAQSVEQAKLELKREEESYRKKRSSSLSPARKPPSKRAKSRLIHQDIFTD